VDIREELSSIELAMRVKGGRKFQMVYIDGSHRFEDVFTDFYFVRQLIDVDGVILFDDSSSFEVKKVIKFIRRNLPDLFEEISVSRYREQSKILRLIYSLATLFGKTQLTIFRKTNNTDHSVNRKLRKF